MSPRATTGPLPLGDTLRDLALLRASDCDLSSVLDPRTTQTASSGQHEDKGRSAGSQETSIDVSVLRSYQFVREARAAIRLLNHGEVDKQGARLADVRAQLEDVLRGIDGKA